LKKLLKICSVLCISFISLSVQSKVHSGYLTIDKVFKFNECIDIAKRARKEIFKDEFGEIIDDHSYNYIRNDIKINILCLEEKNLVILFVSTQDIEPMYYINIFSEYFSQKEKAEAK